MLINCQFVNHLLSCSYVLLTQFKHQKMLFSSLVFCLLCEKKVKKVVYTRNFSHLEPQKFALAKHKRLPICDVSLLQSFHARYIYQLFEAILFPLAAPQNGNRQESSVRAPAPTSLLSPPSRDSHPAEIGSSTTTRNPPAVFPTYPQMTDGVDPVLTTAYSSIYRANEKPIRRSPVRFQGLSTIPSSSSFDDSLEVGSTARLSRSETRPTSSLGLRPVIANNSGILSFSFKLSFFSLVMCCLTSRLRGCL